MAGMLTYAAAGAAAGLGEGLVLRGKQSFEERLRQLDHRNRMEEGDRRDDRADSRADKDRDWRSGEAGKEREHATGMLRDRQGFEAGQADKDRGWRSDEAAAGREHSGAEAAASRANSREGDRFQDDKGFYYTRKPGGGSEPVRDEDGNHIKGPLARSRSGAADDGGLSASDERLLKRVEAMFPKGYGEDGYDAAKVAEHLHGMGRDDLAAVYGGGEGKGMLSGNPELIDRARSMASAEADDKAGWLSTDETDFKDDGGSREAYRNRRTSEIARDLEGGGGKPADKDKAAKGNYPPAPRDPAQRQKGQTYKAPDGRLVKWMGDGWQLVNGE